MIFSVFFSEPFDASVGVVVAERLDEVVDPPPWVAEAGISATNVPGESSFISFSAKSSAPSALNDSTTFFAPRLESTLALMVIGDPCRDCVTGSWSMPSPAGFGSVGGFLVAATSAFRCSTASS